MRELVRLAVSLWLSANICDRSLKIREVSSPIRPAQASAVNPAIPHVARTWVEPLTNLRFLAGFVGPGIMAAILNWKRLAPSG
jgi:hypothetical protein